MTKGLPRVAVLGKAVFVFLLIFAATAIPLMAAPAPGGEGDSFGQYLADHETELTPFFTRNAGEFFKLIVPLIIGITGWVVLFTMLVGWGIDILMSRAYAFFFAPAYAEWKRSVIYATGQLFLSFLYTCLMGLGIVFSLGLPHAGLVVLGIVLLLMVVAFAAQIVWILYLYRTSFGLTFLFYLAVIIVQTIAGTLLAGPLIGARAPATVTAFIDGEITPRLQTEIKAKQHDLAEATTDRDGVKAKTTDLQGQITQAQADKEKLRQEIEAKKNSDIYILAQIVKVRANGDLTSARDQLTEFPTKFPSSPLIILARAQLTAVNDQLAMNALQDKQKEADAARAAAQARAELLEKAGRGEVTLSEMRQALIGKSRAQVKELLGAPNETGADSWGYRQQMIIDPVNNQKHGLIINFNQGLVQGVDYGRYGGGQ